MQNKDFPKVFKGHGEIVVVYKDRVETYTHKRTDTKKSIDKDNTGQDICYNYEDIFGKGWNAHHEAEMYPNNGYKEVHAISKGGN